MGLTGLKQIVDNEIRPGIQNGFSAISDAFVYTIDDAVEEFGESLIEDIKDFSYGIQEKARSLDKNSPEARKTVELLNKKAAKFAEKVRYIKVNFDDAIAELEDLFEDDEERYNADFETYLIASKIPLP